MPGDGVNLWYPPTGSWPWRDAKPGMNVHVEDLFSLATPHVHNAFAVMASVPEHVFWICTPPGLIRIMQMKLCSGYFPQGFRLDYGLELPWPLPNVKLGVGIGDKRLVDYAVRMLINTPAAHRFVSTLLPESVILNAVKSYGHGSVDQVLCLP